jgi:fumarate hydratase class I
MSNKPFHYQDPFPLSKDQTEYYLLTRDHVSVSEFEGQEILKVDPQALTLLAQHAFHDASFMLRPAHQQQVADILSDPEASENDKYVALQFLRNSDIAAKGILPTCQDTGTAIIIGKKASASGPAAAMKRRWRTASTTPIPKITCATRKTRRWICIKRSTPAPTCRADRSLQRRRRRVQIPLHRQRRRFGQQNLSLPGNQSAAHPGEAENYLVEKMRTSAPRPARRTISPL